MFQVEPGKYPDIKFTKWSRTDNWPELLVVKFEGNLESPAVAIANCPQQVSPLLHVQVHQVLHQLWAQWSLVPTVSPGGSSLLDFESWLVEYLWRGGWYPQLPSVGYISLWSCSWLALVNTDCDKAQWNTCPSQLGLRSVTTTTTSTPSSIN